MLHGLPHWFWDVWDGVRFCANLAGAELGTRRNDGPGDRQRLHKRLGPGTPRARLLRRLVREKEAATPFLAPGSGSGGGDHPRLCSTARSPLGEGSRNAPAAPSPPASPRQSQSVGPVNSGRRATTRTEFAGILPDFSLPSAWPPSARRLLPARAVAFASETSRVGQFTPVHARENANWYDSHRGGVC